MIQIYILRNSKYYLYPQGKYFDAPWECKWKLKLHREWCIIAKYSEQYTGCFNLLRQLLRPQNYAKEIRQWRSNCHKTLLPLSRRIVERATLLVHELLFVTHQSEWKIWLHHRNHPVIIHEMTWGTLFKQFLDYQSSLLSVEAKDK